MAYDYIGLVNDVNRRLNEVELTSSNFATAVGEYSMVKDAVNAAIRFVNQHEYEWPFNHVEAEETMTAGVVRYAYPADAKTLDMDSFRIKRDDSLGNDTKRLRIISYEEYLDRYVDIEYNSANSRKALPDYVFRTPSLEFGFVVAPDKAYTVVYEYYRLPVDLINSTDVPSIPEQFRYILLDGAMHFAYMFRGETQESALMQQRFENEIKSMRSLYINRYDYVRSTVIDRNRVAISSFRAS
jgi:hypothetical protein|tara:strand:- start:1783 stop:2505 length:723 start_codon:yes stop_codon:yes gene_type:complete